MRYDHYIFNLQDLITYKHTNIANGGIKQNL